MRASSATSLVLLVALLFGQSTEGVNSRIPSATGLYRNDAEDISQPIGTSFAHAQSDFAERSSGVRAVAQYEQPSTPRRDPFDQYSYSQANQQRARPNNAPPTLNPLMKQASTGAIGLLFGLLIWRSLAAYEMADQFVNETFRILTVVPVMALLLANLIGFIVNIMRPLNFKNHLKAILAVNIIREWIELLYNMVKLVLTSSTAQIPREVYFGRFFMNCWWSFLCFSFSRSRWVLQPSLPSEFKRYNEEQERQRNSFNS
jgi:hypothetical protein